MIGLIEFNNIYAVAGWTILGVLLLIALTIILSVLNKKKIKLSAGDKTIDVMDYNEKVHISEIQEKTKGLNEFELQFKIDTILEKKEEFDYIKNIRCLQEEMNVVERYNITMNLKFKEHYTQVTGYNEGSFQWKYYCLFLLELVKNGGFDFCKRFLKENHIAEKSDDEYRIYIDSKKEEGWNIAKDIISIYYDDNLLTINRLEYFQKSNVGLRAIYSEYMDKIFSEVRIIAIKYQNKCDSLKSEIEQLESELILQCEK